MRIKNYLLTAILALAALSTISCSSDGDGDQITIVDDDLFIGVGKWKIKAPSGISNKSIACDLTEIIFRSDDSYKIVTDKAIVTGKYSFDGNTSISLTKSSSPAGSITNLVVEGGEISFSIELNSGCTQDAEGDKDETYDETEDLNSVIDTTSVIEGQGVYTVATNVTINLAEGETNNPKPEGYEMSWLGIEKIGDGTGKIFIIRRGANVSNWI